jgi:hypothetical protein
MLYSKGENTTGKTAGPGKILKVQYCNIPHVVDISISDLLLHIPIFSWVAFCYRSFAMFSQQKIRISVAIFAHSLASWPQVLSNVSTWL